MTPLHTPHQRFIISISFATGVSLFIYEILWVRILAFSLGATTIALAIVTAVFIAGMGSGSLFFGHRADRAGSRARMFALCNIGIAFFAMAAFFAMQPSSRVFIFLHNVFNTQGNFLGPVIAVSIIIMFIPTFLMGGLLVLLARMYVIDRTSVGKQVGWLYASHALGNILGIAAATYILVPWVGQVITHTTAVLINAAVGGIALAFPIFFANGSNIVTTPKRDRTQRPNTVFLVIAGITGFCALALEILWTRVLRTYVTNSTYSISSVLIVYLAGIACGSIAYFTRLHRRSGSGLLAISLLVIGYYALISLIMVHRLPEVLFLLRNLLTLPVFRITLPGIVLAMILIFIPALCMGLTFPLLCHLYTPALGRLGRSIGGIYFVNMYGSVAGSMCATFILIPILGITRGIGIIALIMCVSALLVFITGSSRKNTPRTSLPVFFAALITLVLVSLGMHQTMILPPSISRSALRSERILYYHETYDGTVIVTEDMHTGIRACYINNNAVCGTTFDALKVVKMLGHLPYCFNPDARRACIIGFGIGITTASLAQHAIDTIECVEICPGVAPATRFFTAYNHNVLNNHHVRLIHQDGRAYLLTTRKRYDIISCDPTHPTLGCNNLYTREYFLLCKERLAPGGVVCQYLPLHKLSLSEFKITIRTFLSVFPHVTVWLAHAHAIMVGTLHEQHLDFEELTGMLHAMNDDIVHDPYDITSSLILNDHAARSFAGNGPLNTDDHPYLEFFSPASTGKENWDGNLYEMISWRSDPICVVRNVTDLRKLKQYLAAQQYFLSALIFKNRGQLSAMLKAMETAHAINPDSEEIRFFLEHERTLLTPVQ